MDKTKFHTRWLLYKKLDLIYVCVVTKQLIIFYFMSEIILYVKLRAYFLRSPCTASSVCVGEGRSSTSTPPPSLAADLCPHI
jgi:hypothetical protein